MKTTPIPVKFDRQGHSCNFYVGFGPMRFWTARVGKITFAQLAKNWGGPTDAYGLLGPNSPIVRGHCCPVCVLVLDSGKCGRCVWPQTELGTIVVTLRYRSHSETGQVVNLPGWCWAEIQQFALVGSSSSLHSEACNALGASDGVIHSRISQEVVCL